MPLPISKIKEKEGKNRLAKRCPIPFFVGARDPAKDAPQHGTGRLFAAHANGIAVARYARNR
jgi:hypothetical protein